MSRKRIFRNLPPLAEVFQDFAGFSETTSKQQALLENLKNVAQSLQQNDSRPFYSMREVVDHFQLPLRTVALAYQSLEMEGFVNRIRGSQTLLVGKKTTLRNPVRAVVGLPIWLHAMVVSPYSRTWNLELEERLRENGFVADLIFFKDREIQGPEFAQRLIDHRLDVVIWHTPHPLTAGTLLSLRDHGVQQIVIQSAEAPLLLSLPTYLQDWSPAYKELASIWKKEGVRQVIIPEPVYLPAKRALKNFTTILREQGLEPVFTEDSAKHLCNKLAQFKNKRACAIAFMDQQGADAICNEEPALIEELMRQTRVAFCRGPIRIPYFHHRDARADIVRFSAVEMADKVVEDLHKLSSLPKKIIHTFVPAVEPQRALSENAESL